LKLHAEKIFYPNLDITPNHNMPNFYKNIITYWSEISRCNPITVNSVITQSLCFNFFIKIDNTYIAKTFEGVLFVNDLLDSNGFLSWQDFKNKY